MDLNFEQISTGNKILSVYMGQPPYWFYNYEIENLYKAWLKFRDTKLDTFHKVELLELKKDIGHSIAFENIEEAFLKLVAGVEWLNKIKQ
jgi:hypothetical protein